MSMHELCTYYSNGVLYIEETRIDGQRNGNVKVYDVNGNDISTLEYWEKTTTRGIYIIRNAKYGHLQCVTLFQNDSINDSPFSPAIVQWYSDGNIENIYHYKNDKLHNTNGPAEITFYENGICEYINYHILDCRQSINNMPSHIEWKKSGKIEFISYHQNDKLHNTNGPADLDFYNNKLETISFYKNGLLHRDDLPAIISIPLYLIGSKVSYWRDGVLVRDYPV